MRTITTTVFIIVCTLVTLANCSRPFGAEWTEVEPTEYPEEGSEQTITEEDEDEEVTAKEKIAKWMLRRLEGVILAKVKETSFVNLITGDSEKENSEIRGSTTVYYTNNHVNVAAVVLFVVALAACVWCIVVRHLLRGAVIILSVVFFIFLVVVAFYPTY